MSWHGYIGLENLALNASQKAQLVAALRALGNQSGPQPHLLTQYRARLDDEAAIIEAQFADGDVDIATVKQYLANVFGIDPGLITHTVNNTVYGPLVTYRYQAINRIRLIPFSGINATWEESRVQASAYIIANVALWEPSLAAAVPSVNLLGRVIPAFTTPLGAAIWNAGAALVNRIRGNNGST